jgi:outer membrane protein assembly factor BamE
MSTEMNSGIILAFLIKTFQHFAQAPLFLAQGRSALNKIRENGNSRYCGCHAMTRILYILFVFFLGACSYFDDMNLRPYKTDIYQGNVVDQKMIAQLRPGMSKAQVRFIMGTPLVKDAFHSDRWDYVYRLQKGGGKIEQRRVTAVFENDTLTKLEGDVVPGEVGDDALPEAMPLPMPEQGAGELNKPTAAATPDASADAARISPQDQDGTAQTSEKVPEPQPEKSGE